MKKTVLILVLALICFTAGCKERSQTSGDSNSVLDSIKNTYTETKEGVFDEAGNYENHIGMLRTMHDGRFGWGGCLVGSLNHTAELIGTVDDETKYVVFRMNDEKIGDYYAYFFYRYNGLSEPTIYYNEDGSVSRVEENQPYWHLVGREVRIIKHLTANDFEDIVVGSTIEDVAKVDPLTEITIPLSDALPNNYPFWNGYNYSKLSFDTFHYTDDGILRITFSRETVDDEYRVSEIELNSTFEVSPYDGYKPWEGREPLVKLKINPEHIPN